jgi:molybdenum cofactor biosynthesis protein B
MVDFQSRDTRRGDDDDEEEEEVKPDEDSAEAGDGEAEDASAGGEPDPETFGVALLTVSDSRSAESDPPAASVKAALSAEMAVQTREVLAPTHDSVQGAIDRVTAREDIDAVVVTGGTGLGADDVTVEAITPLVEKALPGFGEAFRRQYAEAVGSDAIASRATAGIIAATPVFCLPGEADAAGLATEELIITQAPRLSTLAAEAGQADP